MAEMVSFRGSRSAVRSDIGGSDSGAFPRLSEEPQRPIIELLKEHLALRNVLLLLDSSSTCWGQRGGQRPLAAAPRLTVLVTSRSTLNLYGEQEFACTSARAPGTWRPCGSR